MPFIAPKTAVAFTWDSFPPPPPEAGSWTPPVDSIPKPGALPDRRFNRDPESDRRSKSFKRERYLGAGQVGSNTSHEFASSAALGTNGMGSGLGAWPAPASRATGYPRDPIAIANSARPAVHRPPTPDLLAVPHRSASPFKSAVPAWAAPLEKAMAEDELKKVTAVSCSATVKADSKNDGKGLTPPHLRNTSRLSNGVSRAPLCTSQVANPGASSTATDYATLAQRDVFVRDENLAWTLVTTGLGIEDAKDGLHFQTAMIREYDNNQRGNAPNGPSCIYHEHKVKVMLIRGMEHELDLEKVTSERSLMNMSSIELGKYYDKVCSVHKSWWEAGRRT